MYLKITPDMVRSSLVSLQRGRKPLLAPAIVADYVLHHGVPEKREPLSEFERFARRIYGLPDPRTNS